MPRSNSPKRRIQQRAKMHVEDRLARRAVKQAVEDSYRNEPILTIEPGGHRILTFTDPSFLT